jgi:hypothetical protein
MVLFFVIFVRSSCRFCCGTISSGFSRHIYLQNIVFVRPRWSSGKLLASHAGAPASILWATYFFLCFLRVQ